MPPDRAKSTLYNTCAYQVQRERKGAMDELRLARAGRHEPRPPILATLPGIRERQEREWEGGPGAKPRTLAAAWARHSTPEALY